MKRMVRYSVFVLLLVPFAMAVAAPAPRVLWVLSAKKAIVTKENKDYQLVLKNPLPAVLYFSDRPRRFAGHLRATQFLMNWPKDGFSKSPPNSAFVHSGMSVALPSKQQQAFAFELDKPKQIGNNEWKFDIRMLKGDSIQTGDYHNVSLFIDSSAFLVSGAGEVPPIMDW